MKTVRSMVLLLVLALMLLPAAGGRAEEEKGYGEMPKLWVIHFDEVDPSMTQQFEEAGEAWVKAFREAELGAEWSWFASSGPSFTYAYGWSIDSFGMLDRWGELDKKVAEAIGAEKLAELEKMTTATVRSHRSEIVEGMEDLSYRPKKSSMTEREPGYQHVEVHWVKPAMLEQYQALVKKAIGALGEAEHPLGWSAFRVRFGEGDFVYVTSADSAGQFYSAPDVGDSLTKALGQEAAQQMYQEFRDCISKYETSDWNPRPEMSFMPQMETAEAME